MPPRRRRKINWLPLSIVAAVVVVVAVVLAIINWGAGEAAGKETVDKDKAATLIQASDGAYGLSLSKDAYEGLKIDPQPVRKAAATRPLPAQSGTLNYDTERLFSIPGRVAGEIAEFAEKEEPGISGQPVKRPYRYGDKVKQGQLLAVIYSPTMGQQKAALVDAINNLRLSEENLDRHKKLYSTGDFGYSQLKQDEQKVQIDKNAVLSAERTLRLWKMTTEEIQAIKQEADDIHNRGLERNAETEARRWGRVEVRVPVFDPEHMERELTIVEKNTNLISMIDPVNTQTPLFRVADLSRLQIWAHPPEEYLPLVRKMLDNGGDGPALWDVQFQSDPPGTPAQRLSFYGIAPSLDPAQHTPMVIGHIDNPKGTTYVVGQFVTVTMYVKGDPDTVEVPTEALNEINGESLVFVQPNASRYDFIQRRVLVVARFKDVSFVRSKLSDKEKQQSTQEVAAGRRPLYELQVNDRLVTRGVLEMTACLETLLTEQGKR
jgi:cobalt-zinc-cadmium efflux system membrane fusion protein